LRRTFSYSLSFVAGYVDACTFLALFGLYVAQVTGSFVSVGTELIERRPGSLIKVLAIPIFMAAAAAATVLVSLIRDTQRSAWPWLLGLELVLLLAFLLIGEAANPFTGPDQPAALGAALCGLAAMGVQSAAVRLLQKGAPSTNVMTTNTTQFAIDVTQVLLARIRIASSDPDLTAVRRRCVETAGVIVGFFGGVIIGAVAFRAIGFTCLLPVIAVLLALAAAAARRPIE
jgi:uncharacterized membrane protein YoaK (UPF0700 family)